jgi:hypothetical protein
MTDLGNFAALESRPDATLATVGSRLPRRTGRCADPCAGEPGAGRPTVPSKTRLFSMQLRIARRQGTRSRTASRSMRWKSNSGCSPLGGSTLSECATNRNGPLAPTSTCAVDRRRDVRTCAPDRAGRLPRCAVERVDSSDMLTRAYKAGISRGFEFFGNEQQTPRSQIRGPRGPGSDPARTRSGDAWPMLLSWLGPGPDCGSQHVADPAPPAGVADVFRRPRRLDGPRSRASSTARHASASAGLPSARARNGAAWGLHPLVHKWACKSPLGGFSQGPPPVASRGMRNEETV